MTATYAISIVIPTFQRCASVRRVIQALCAQTVPADQYEVIVSIDGSEDGTRELVAQFAAPYRLHAVWQPNRGRAAACNAGIQMASGALLILLDDDMEPSPEFLAAHMQAHRAGARLGVIGAVPINVDQASSMIVEYIGTKFNQHLEKLAQPGYQLQLRDFYSGNFSIRRDILLNIGLFDEAFKIYGNEDIELSLRLLRADVELIYSPEALAWQDYTKDFAALARDHIAKGRTAVLLASKYPDTLNELKLSTYYQASMKWRLLRAALLRLSRWSGRTPDQVIRFIQRLELRRPARMNEYYRMALDYFFWLGAISALSENHRAGQGLGSLPKLAENHQL